MLKSVKIKLGIGKRNRRVLIKGKEDMVYRLDKALYGLKKAIKHGIDYTKLFMA